MLASSARSSRRKRAVTAHVPADTEKLLIVIPAYNEAGRVGPVVRTSTARCRAPTCSSSTTARGTQPRRRPAAAGAIALSLPVNGGYGTALQTGYKYAVRNGYALVGQIDADGQHRAEYLSQMLDVLRDDDADVVVGSRFLARDDHYKTPLGTLDRDSALRAPRDRRDRPCRHRPHLGLPGDARRDRGLYTQDLFPVDYPDADILILLHRTGYRVREVPVQMRPSPGTSMHTSKSTPYYVYKMLLSILVTVLRPRPKRTR